MLNSKGIEKAFRVTLVFFVAFLLVCFIADRKVNAATPNNFKNYYSTLLKVVSVEWDTELKVGRAFFTDCNNNVYSTGIVDGDIFPGDFYTAIVYTNKTVFVYDDIIVKIKYCRVDLF